MDESIPETTKDDADGLSPIRNADHALQKEKRGTSQLPSDGKVLNTPMYSTEDWELLYELRSLDGRKQNMCCLKAYVLYCVYSIRLKISKPKKMEIGNPNVFIIPTVRPDQSLSINKAASVTDVHPDIPSSETGIFDSRTGIIEEKRQFTFMSTVMNVPDNDLMTDLQVKDGIVNNVKHENFDEIKAVVSVESIPSKDIESVTTGSERRIQREKKQGRFQKMFRWWRRK